LNKILEIRYFIGRIFIYHLRPARQPEKNILSYFGQIRIEICPFLTGFSNRTAIRRGEPFVDSIRSSAISMEFSPESISTAAVLPF
jgi:hypothetical protein